MIVPSRTPRVSVIMPVYNALPYLPAALDSVLRQSLEEIEVLVFDDGSTDGSGEYLDGVQDPRVRVEHVPKQGYGELLNRGLSIAAAPLIARMDADDICLPERLERQVGLLEQNRGAVVCGGQIALIDPAGRVKRGPVYPLHDVHVRYRMLRRNPIAHPAAMFRTADARAVGGYNTGRVPSEDYDLWWRLSRRGQLLNAPEILLHYRLHSENVSVVQRPDQQRLCQQIREQYLQEMGLAGDATEIREFTDCWDAVYSTKYSGPPPAGWPCYAALLERFFDRHADGQSPEGPGPVAQLRRELRWACLGHAQRAAWGSRCQRQWLGLARRLDPREMTLGRLATRAFRKLCFPTRS